METISVCKINYSCHVSFILKIEDIKDNAAVAQKL